MKKVFIGCLIAFFVVGLLIILVLGYFGIIPFVAHILKTDKPRDLGITVSQNDRDKNKEIFGDIQRFFDSGDIENDTKIEYFGSVSRNVTLTSSQVTASIIDNQWRYKPVSEVQIKFGDNGDLEASGMLHADKVKQYLINSGINQDEINAWFDKLNLNEKNIPFYIKANIEVIDNQLSISVSYLELGRLPIPNNLVSSNVGVVAEAINKRIKSIPNLDIKELKISEGVVSFIGTTPEYEKVFKD